MDSLRFSVVPFTNCVDEVIAFRNLNRPIQRDDEYFDWRYRRRPCTVPAHIVWCRDEHGRPLGSASIIAHDFFVRDGVRPVGMLGDVSVLPECRGRGVGARMIAALHGHPALAGLAGSLVLPNEAAVSAFAHAHWREATKIERFVRVLDIGPRLRARLGAKTPVQGLANAINAVLRWRSPRSALDHHEVDAAECSSFDGEYDALWSELDHRGSVLALRNQAYLQWRYSAHPATRYARLALRQGGRLRAWVVFHTASDTLHVDDFLAATLDTGTALIDALVRHASANRIAATIQVNASRPACTSVPWPGRGFVHRPDSQPVMTSPPQGGHQPWFGPEDTPWRVTSGDKDV